jgi:hypothetical protein
LELAGVKAIRFFNRLGLFPSLRPLPTDQLAKEMLRAAKESVVG